MATQRDRTSITPVLHTHFEGPSMSTVPAAPPAQAIAPITVLIVDDEWLGRERLAQLLAGEPEVTVIGQCTNGLEALRLITDARPELVFLDVQMPDLDGLGVLDALGETECPEIVFVTAHNEYMERAFEVHAVDYLRKPYTNRRFTSALAHARQRVVSRRGERSNIPGDTVGSEAMPGSDYTARYSAVLSRLDATRLDARIALQDPTTGTWHIVTRDEISWIEADGSGRTRVHTAEGAFVWRRTLTELEHEATRYGFIRVHRSCIVNGTKIRSVKPLQKGEYALVLADGTVLDTGRTYRDVIEAFLNRANAAPSRG